MKKKERKELEEKLRLERETLAWMDKYACTSGSYAMVTRQQLKVWRLEDKLAS